MMFHQRNLRFLAEAHNILANPCDGNCRTAEEWRRAAQECVDTNGEECGDLIHFLAEQEAFETRWPEPELTQRERNSMSLYRELELTARAAAKEAV